MKQSYHIAIVGATGTVGNELLSILNERNFPVSDITLLASERSVGESLDFQGKDIPVEILNNNSFENVDIAFFSAGSTVSKEFAPIAAKAGAVVIDNTSAFRMDKCIPLIVPEVNGDEIACFETKRIIANPNCSTIQMVMALHPLHESVGIKRIIVNTYQSVSGAGRKAIEELSKQTTSLFTGNDAEKNVFPHQIAFNCIPQIGAIDKNGISEEEYKMMHETKRILNDDRIEVFATTVRVPVFSGHAESINIEFESDMDIKEAAILLSDMPGVTVVDEPMKNNYPMPSSAIGNDDVYVGRIRKDPTVAHGLAMWVVSDNLRKGAALNAVQIAELLTQQYLDA